MKYAIAVIQLAFAFGLFLSAPDFPDITSFATTDMMAETNYLWMIYLVTGFATMSLGEIVEVKFSKWRGSTSRSKNQSARDTKNTSGIDATMKTPPTIVVRGYDSDDLFREDALIRIRELDREIAEAIKSLILVYPLR
jgi:hypothetical protein